MLCHINFCAHKEDIIVAATGTFDGVFLKLLVTGWRTGVRNCKEGSYFLFIVASRMFLVVTSARIESILELIVNKNFIDPITSI